MNNPIVLKSLLYLGVLLGIFAIILLIQSIINMLKKKDIKSLWIPYLSWFILIPILLIPLLLGRLYFISAVLLLALASFREFTRATGLWTDKSFVWAGYLSIALIFYPIFVDWYGLYTAMPIYCLLAVLAIPIVRREFEHMVQKTCLTILGILYFGWLFSHLAFFENMQGGIGYIIFIIVLVELNDVMASTFGKLFGRHKLIPRISPNKTIEGAALSLIGTLFFAHLFKFAIPEYSNWQIWAIAILISIGGTCGDLVISFIKRDLQIKDMGKLIPGHGGVLDRFDSLIFVVPIFFHFTRYFFWTRFFNP